MCLVLIMAGHCSIIAGRVGLLGKHRIKGKYWAIFNGDDVVIFREVTKLFVPIFDTADEAIEYAESASYTTVETELSVRMVKSEKLKAAAHLVARRVGKCPTCDGRGRIMNLMTKRAGRCMACDGKGKS